ncbi:MAG TPA: hypothetical protein VJ731_13970 [Terriglobales bacterium]|nr:hypothetical protein [Terriglobales bacterium]
MRSRLPFLAAGLLGLSISTGIPAGIVAAITMPALIFRQTSRRAASVTALLYYACAIWPVIPGARNFFGADVSLFAAFLLWSIAMVSLSFPWAVLWSPNRTQMLWRIPIALIIASVPPLGVIGWASPLTAAGLLFPATAWIGLLACAGCATALGVFPRVCATSALLLAALANAIHPRDLAPPLGWKAVNTEFGGVAHSTMTPGTEYQIAEAIQHEALCGDAAVIVFPETVVPYWTDATDQFWRSGLDALRAKRKTILVGALVPRSERSHAQPVDFSAGIAALKSGDIPLSLPPQQEIPDSRGSFFNAVEVRGTERNEFRQRIPVPIAMWNPISKHGAPINILGPGILTVRGERAAVLICYEQLLVWPVLSSMAQAPTIMVAIANDYWATGTTIPRFQRCAVRAWSRLFGIPYVSAVNF